MGAAAATQLAACDQAPPTVQAPPAFTTVQDCVAGGFSQQECQTAYDQAIATHQQNAPRFNTREECEAGVDVERCVQTQVRQPDGSFANVFLPAIGGFLLGQALANRGPGWGGGWGGGFGGGYIGGPIYRSRDYGGYRSYDDLLSTRRPGGSVPSIGDRPRTSAPIRPPNVNTTTISRQGFGGRGFGSGGG